MFVEDDPKAKIPDFRHGHFDGAGGGRVTLDAGRAVSTRGGPTVHEEIQRVQLGTAQQLLTTTNLPVEEVAQRAGFSSAQYMNAVFHRLLGQTPGRYRVGARQAIWQGLVKIVLRLRYIEIHFLAGPDNNVWKVVVVVK